MKILVVEDNPMDQAIIKANLTEHELILVESGEEALDAISQEVDLILMDINLPGIDGYETCKKMRQHHLTQQMPIIFLTTLTGLDDRIKAFDVGGDDHLSKPCNPRLLRSKVEVYAKIQHKLTSSKQEAKNAIEALMDIQSQSSKIQSISRFVQASMFCHDLNTLLRLFINTAKEIGANCVIRVDCELGSEMRSTSGNISVLEREIIEHAVNVGRIHQFGQQRAIFKWPHAILLTLKIGDLIDILAIFMDALDAAIKSIETEALLIDKVKHLETENSLVRDQIADIFDRMGAELGDTILSLGIVSALDLNDEDRLNDLIQSYSQIIRAKLADLESNNHEIQTLVNDLRTPPEEIQKIIDSQTQAADDGGIELF
jgi:CheY-like chemotaxis protein